MFSKKKFLSLISILCITLTIHSQNIFQNNKFTSIPILDGTAVLLKEIPLKNNNLNKSFSSLQNWGKINFGNEPLVSSIRVISKDRIIYCKSKVELLLQKDKKGIREKVMMSYKLDAFLINNKCVLEIKDIKYHINKQQSLDLIKSNFSAEEMVSNNAIQTNDKLKELRNNTRASTLYFFNNLADNLVLNINL